MKLVDLISFRTGRRSRWQSAILQTGCFLRRLLVHGQPRRQIRLLLQQRGLGIQLEGGVVQRPRNRLRARVGDAAGSVGSGGYVNTRLTGSADAAADAMARASPPSL